eukprot:TRINITY_DN13545_c0_g1_i1.p1 TRINITY_DN13545_c0_g1~~TRINITY_DN13545_c0_g1_i1.p1  ORF type:complete len:213 (+),score=22.09 TRINITY_DN13545_c0_g1_i1:37-639(+)
MYMGSALHACQYWNPQHHHQFYDLIGQKPPLTAAVWLTPATVARGSSASASGGTDRVGPGSITMTLSSSGELSGLQLGFIATILLINGGVFIMWQKQPEEWLRENFTFGPKNLKQGRWWTWFTAFVSHKDTWHIFANSMGFLESSMSILPVFGVPGTLSLFILAGLGGNLAYWIEKSYRRLPGKMTISKLSDACDKRAPY